MVITQKVTSLAFSIHDGLTRREEELTPMQRHQAVQWVLFLISLMRVIIYIEHKKYQ